MGEWDCSLQHLTQHPPSVLVVSNCLKHVILKTNGCHSWNGPLRTHRVLQVASLATQNFILSRPPLGDFKVGCFLSSGILPLVGGVLQKPLPQYTSWRCFSFCTSSSNFPAILALLTEELQVPTHGHRLEAGEGATNLGTRYKYDCSLCGGRGISFVRSGLTA